MSDASSNAPVPPNRHPDANQAKPSHVLKNESIKYGPVAAIAITIGTFFASQFLVGLSFGLLPVLLGWDVSRVDSWLTESVLARFMTILAVEAVMLWLLWQFMKSRNISLASIGLVKPEIRDISYAIIGYVSYFVLFIALTIAVKGFFPGLDLEQEQQIGFSRSTTGNALWLVFASLVILPPIAEEIVCRGFLYTGLRNKLPKITAAIITSIIFAAAHLQWGSGNALLWAAALDTFVLSIILVYLRDKTESLWSPILVHMIKNGLAFSLLFIFHL